MSDVYQYIDKNRKQDTNELVVTFVFDNETTASQAVAQIDKLVRLADNRTGITFTAHQPDVYVVSPIGGTTL